MCDPMMARVDRVVLSIQRVYVLNVHELIVSMMLSPSGSMHRLCRAYRDQRVLVILLVLLLVFFVTYSQYSIYANVRLVQH